MNNLMVRPWFDTLDDLYAKAFAADVPGHGLEVRTGSPCQVGQEVGAATLRGLWQAFAAARDTPRLASGAWLDPARRLVRSRGHRAAWKPI